MKEIFKTIPDYEKYQVSNFGRVKSFNKHNGTDVRILKPSVKRDYLGVTIINSKGKKTFPLHKLVAIVFLGHIPCGHKEVVDHLDGNPLNNRVDNLRITTQRENVSKKNIKSSSCFVGVDFIKGSNKWRAQLNYSGKTKYLGVFDTQVRASIAYNLALFQLDKFKNIGHVL